MISIDDIFKAANEIEYHYPPKTIDDVMRLLASLNLLNAAVKMPVGTYVTTYSYIKGHVGLLFIWLLYHPMEDVSTYWSEEDDIVYFSVPEYQFSFHRVPLLSLVRHLTEKLKPQQWDGIRLQLIALDIFQSITSCRKDLSEARKKELLDKMHSFNQKEMLRILYGYNEIHHLCHKEIYKGTVFKKQIIPFHRESTCPISHDKSRTLFLAIKFDGFEYDEYELYRAKDTWRMMVVCYNGENYKRMIRLFYGKQPKKILTNKDELIKGVHYYMDRRSHRLKPLTVEDFYFIRAYYSNIIINNSLHNLCITYNIALYLSDLFPDLQFINILNYARPKVKGQLYTSHDLKQVAPHSKSRDRKVWMVVDKYYDLKHFSTLSIPQELVVEYKEMQDYLVFHHVKQFGDKVGLKSYGQFYLLPPIYSAITIQGDFALVKNDHGKEAIYSLIEEEFVTEFM